VSLLTQRWRSRELIGDAQHALIVRLRPGYMKRGYLDEQRIDNNSPIYPPLIYEGRNIDCFKSVWTPTGPWKELPNIQSVKWSRSYNTQTGGENGGATGTIVMDNIGFPDVTGAAGLYHAIDRGYYSPGRGVTGSLRPKLWTDKANAWKQVLDAGWQVEVWEGYGTGTDVQLRSTLFTTPSGQQTYAPASGALARTYTGIVTNCEQESHPDHITLTTQDFSVFLTDQRVAGWNKALEIPSPVTFADRKRTEGEAKLSGPYRTSSNSAGNDGQWQSDPHTSQTDTSGWIEMTLPKGYYEQFFVNVPATETIAVSLYMADDTGNMDRVHPLPAGWVDLTGPGTGTVNGYPYMRKMRVADSPSQRWDLGHSFNVPDNSKLRLTITKRYQSNGSYYAGTDQFFVYQFGTDPANPPPGTPKTLKTHGWILVEDVAEIVRMIFIWAGFQEWHVEDFGWSLFVPYQVASNKFHIDVINDTLQQGNFIFYMGQPTNDDRSIGVPHFEYSTALNRAPTDMISVRDTDMTESLTLKWDLSDLPHVLRYRGAIVKGKTQGGVLMGFGIDGMTRRWQATYYPPWSGQWRDLNPPGGGITYITADHVRRDGGVLRQFTGTGGDMVQTQFESNAECLMACVLAALSYALNMTTVQFQIPGIAPLNLNAQMAVIDEATAVNSRVWLASIESEHVTGGSSGPGHWRMTIGGALLDTDDVDTIRTDYNYAWKKAQANKAALAQGVPNNA
jgi:hypothetical protein